MFNEPKISIGTDIVDIYRINDAISKFSNRFLKKIFTEYELKYCINNRINVQSLAARFAAKEAFSKALGIGIGVGSSLKWHDVSVKNTNFGQPEIKLSENSTNLMKRYGFNSAKISLSHTKTLAQAVVILIG